MRERTRKGHAFIFIMLVLLGIVVLSALLFARSARVESAPTVVEVFWRADGRRVTTAGVGDEVEAHVIIKATGKYEGSIVVKIRKDISLWFDSDHSITTVPANLRGGQEIELELMFVPDEASGGSLRGYFVEVEFSATHTSWVMESSYPPRLNVT